MQSNKNQQQQLLLLLLLLLILKIRYRTYKLHSKRSKQLQLCNTNALTPQLALPRQRNYKIALVTYNDVQRLNIHTVISYT